MSSDRDWPGRPWRLSPEGPARDDCGAGGEEAVVEALELAGEHPVLDRYEGEHSRQAPGARSWSRAGREEPRPRFSARKTVPAATVEVAVRAPNL